MVKKVKVEIKIDYTNNETKTVDGKSFMSHLLWLQEQCFQRIMFLMLKLQMGKLLVMGHQILIMAIAAPDLSKNYNNNKDLEKFNSISIKYDTTKFKLNSLMSVATPSLLSDTDINFDDMNEIYDNVDTLNSSFDQIISGGSSLTIRIKTICL